MCVSPSARQRIGYLKPELTYYYKFSHGGGAAAVLRADFRHVARAAMDRRIDELLKLVELEAVRKRPIKSYSKGMQQRGGTGPGPDQQSGPAHPG